MTGDGAVTDGIWIRPTTRSMKLKGRSEKAQMYQYGLAITVQQFCSWKSTRSVRDMDLREATSTECANTNVF